jgi:hypothetical protein
VRAPRIALVCIDPWDDAAGDSPQFRPFDYSVRRIEAASRAPGAPDAEVRLIERGDTDVDALFDEVCAFEPDVVGASAFVWSFPTFVELARRLRVDRPHTRVVFGGPSARPAMFGLEPFRDGPAVIDALVPGEGEEVFPDIVRAYAEGRAFAEVPGLRIPRDGAWASTGERAPPDLDRAPSPYALGLVPSRYSGHLESFRGCPLACSFCQWGDYGAGASRTFSVEHLVRELEAMRRSDVLGVWLVDAALNLNPRAFRNLREAERRVGLLRERHFHTEIYPAHLTSEHLDFLGEIEADAVGIGLQSYDKEVLRRMGRPFDEARFETVVRDARAVVGSVHIELIMGLPGDRPEAFLRTLDRARALGADLRIYHCLVLPDALMTRAPAGADVCFDPHTLAMRSCDGWTARDFERIHAVLDDAVKDGGYAHRGTGSWTLHADRPMRAGLASRAGVEPALVDAVARATLGRWTLTGFEPREGGARATFGTPLGALVVDLRPASADARAFVVAGGVGLSYQQAPGVSVPASTLGELRDLASALVAALAPALGGARGRTRLPLA